jgi:hypothetical protein
MAGLPYFERLRDLLRERFTTRQVQELIAVARGHAGGIGRGEKGRQALAAMTPPDYRRLSDAQLRHVHSRIHALSPDQFERAHSRCVAEMGRRSLKYKCEKG